MTSAMVETYDNKNNSYLVRALLDTCATANFVTTKLAKKLQLPTSKCHISISALNNLSTTVNNITSIKFKSTHNNYTRTLNFLIVPKIVDFVPSELIPRNLINIPHNIKLADPNFHKPAEVDMLIGAGPTLSMFSIGTVNLSQGENDFYLQKTTLGWILAGGVDLSKNIQFRKTSNCLLTDLENSIEKFWAVEELTNKSITQEEIECESHFQKHVKRDAGGKYTVALPFKRSPAELGDSKQTALSRLRQLQKKFKRDPEFKKQYSKVMNEYLELNHMTLETSINTEGFYLPHHGVIKNSSETTKLRVVFDASAKTSSGLSLNDILMVGPTIQDELFTIILRFRFYVYAMIADIEKMYRQFLIREEDRKFLKILWLNENDKITEYQLNTVTFGLGPAPFLAIRCLRQLVQDQGHQYPLAAEVLKRDFYVDNLVSGANSLEEARQIQSQLIQLMSQAQLKLRQWASNEQQVLDGIDDKSIDNNFKLNNDFLLKTLGIFWKARTDTFNYLINTPNFKGRITKRIILSDIAKLFDPLGLLGPVLLYAKKIMQNLWQSGVTWDESVTSAIYWEWVKFCTQLKELNEISFPRRVVVKEVAEIQIHGFCDASEKGYGACLYVRSSGKHNQAQVFLLCSKSRVAPLKQLTIPKLELCGAQVLAQLYEKLKQTKNFTIKMVTFWTDSEIVLHWLNTSSNLLKTFVSNRVSEIQRITENNQWRHVRSVDNPADALSRGQLPREFLKNKLWLHGPSWLCKSEEFWPKQFLKYNQHILPEMKKAQCLVLPTPLHFTYELSTLLNHKSFTDAGPPVVEVTRFKWKTNTENIPELKFVQCMKLNTEVDLLCKYSSFEKLKRIVAYICRIQTYKRGQGGKLTVNELNYAEKVIIKLIQRQCFSREIERLSKAKCVDKTSRIFTLDPILGTDGVLRVGGRLRHSELSYQRKHPMILPKSNFITDLLITYYHHIHRHTGIQTTLYILRQKYWIIDGRNEIKKIIRSCITCCRARPKLATHKMGDLPAVRVTKARAFQNVGIDYCGHFFIKERKFRNLNKIKTYVAIFVCMVTKAIHIEVVSDLTTEGFLGALSRFVHRRGKPDSIHCDNASNFKGAKNELNELYALIQSQKLRDKVYAFSYTNNIEFHFIPPSSPHFGGLWEAGVKSFKHHLKRVTSDTLLTFEQFNTLAIEIEAVLNSRPLTPVSNDINDCSALTPGHFLINDSLISLPEPDLLSLPSNRLSAWQLISKIRQNFWKRWHLEYLNELNVRRKWNVNSINPVKGALVIVKDDNLPCMQWQLARITELHPGKDGIVRCVTIRRDKISRKIELRKLAILPVE